MAPVAMVKANGVILHPSSIMPTNCCEVKVNVLKIGFRGRF